MWVPKFMTPDWTKRTNVSGRWVHVLTILWTSFANRLNGPVNKKPKQL